MQFLYNSPSEISSGFPPVSVVTEELLHANSIYNESVELFERLKHSNHCCQCEKRRPVKKKETGNGPFQTKIVFSSFWS